MERRIPLCCGGNILNGSLGNVFLFLCFMKDSDLESYEDCVAEMICQNCGLELDADMDEAVENEVIEEPCECTCHTLC